MFDISDIHFTVVALWKPTNQKQSYYAVVRETTDDHIPFREDGQDKKQNGWFHNR